jgi:glycosyltransferase involved in cell wall biosynthesis
MVTRVLTPSGATKRINILFVIDYFHRTGGTEKHLAQLVRLLPRERFRCAIVGFDVGANPLLDEVRHSDVPVLHVAVGREYAPNAAYQAWRLARIIREHDVDIVQTFHQKSDTFGAIVAKLAGVKHIVSSKRDVAELKRPRHFALNRLLRPLFERVIVVADAVGDVVVEKEGFEREKIARIYNGVDEIAFAMPTLEQRNAARRRFGFEESDVIVGMVAGFRPEKDYETFFKGSRDAMKKIPQLKLLAVGGGPLLDHYRAECSGSELGQRIVFTGAVPDVRECLSAMDIGCLIPKSNEGFSNAVLEKMAFGLPLVVTNVGGNCEAVVSGGNGIVIEKENASALTGSLVSLYADAEARMRMGRMSRRIVEERFTLGQMVAQHASLYAAMVG